MIPVIPSIYIPAPPALDLFCHFDILGLCGPHCSTCIDNARVGRVTARDKNGILGTGGTPHCLLCSCCCCFVYVFVPPPPPVLNTVLHCPGPVPLPTYC